MPGRIRCFVAVKRIFPGSALSIAYSVIRSDGEEDDPSFIGSAKTGFEKVDQRQMDLTQLNRLDSDQ
jgi:hypothetical protein